MSRSTLQTGPDDKPRAIVVIPVVLICLGSMLLLFVVNRPARREVTAPRNQAVSGPAETNTPPGAASRMTNRRATSDTAPRPTASVARQPKPLSSAGDALPARPLSPPSTGGADAVIPIDSGPGAGALPADRGVEIRGRVTLEGTPPEEIRIDMAGDPQCGRLHSAPLTTRHYVVDADGGLANVLVYVKSGLKGKFPVPADQPLLNQTGCFYEPYVMGVMAGQRFRIRSSDPAVHNVHALPRQGDNREFNFVQAAQGQETEKTFPSPEVFVRFKCDVHPWMFAYLGVVGHPYYAVTTADGAFLLPPDLPAGTYTLEAVHPKAGSATQEITAKTGDRQAVDFVLRVPVPGNG
jgi:hypothetical protein